MSKSRPGQNLRVSVALATYNGEKFVVEQLRSMVHQSCPPYEIVVHDDASTDSTWSHLKQFQSESIVPVRLFRNSTNVGYIQNFARAIKSCRGDYIALADQDDYWLPTRLEAVVEAICSHPGCGAVVTNAEVVDANLDPWGVTLYGRLSDAVGSEHQILDAMLKKSIIKGCTVVFRSDLRPYLFPFPKHRWGHDHWIVLIASVLSHVFLLEKPMMYYRRHAHNSGNDPTLDHPIKGKIVRAWQNLNLEAYQRDYYRWYELYHHLSSIDPPSEEARLRVNALAMSKISDRLELARIRLELRQKRRTGRPFPILSLLRNRWYHRFANGFQTAVKDIIA